MESLSRPPHRRKHSAATNASSSSFSLRNPYEGVLLSRGGKTKFQPHDYAEIFAGSSSIPVLDLSGLGEPVRTGCRSSELDYSNIFGGANADDVAVSYENLFNGGVKKNKTRNPTDAAFQERGSLTNSGKVDRSSGEHGQSTEGIKQQFNMSFNKTSQRSSDESNGKTHVAHLHVVPGFTHFVDGTPQLPKIEGDRPVPSKNRDVSRTWSFSSGIEGVTVNGGLCSEKSNKPYKPHKENGINVESHISKLQPPVGHPSSPIDNKDIKKSGIPDFGSKDASKETIGENSPPLFDEELDENSDAGVSIAALKKAIEHAQESIKLAKMIMQKKREGTKDGSRAGRSNGRSKVDDKKESSTKHVYGDLRENNVKEKSQQFDPTISDGVDGKCTPMTNSSDNLFNAGMAKVETKMENFEATNDHSDEADKKFAPSCYQSESVNIDKVEAENIRQNVEVSEAHKEAINFIGKVSNDNLICSKSKAVPCLEHVESDKETLEQKELTMHQPKCSETLSVKAESIASNSQSVKEPEESINEEAVERCRESVGATQGSVDLAEQLERVLECSGSMQEQKKVMHKGDEYLRISSESEQSETEASDSTPERKKGVEKFVEHEELDFPEHLEIPNILNNDSQCPNEKNMMDQADIDKKPENESEWKEDVQEFSNEDENGMISKEPILWFESEMQLEEPVEEVMNDRESDISLGVQEAVTEVDMVSEPETNHEKLNLEHEEHSQIVPRECEENEIAIRCIDTAESEAVETLQVGGTNNYSEVQNGEIPSDVEEGECEEHRVEFEFHDAGPENDTGEDSDAHSNDSGSIDSDKNDSSARTISSETPEPSNVEFNNKEEIHQAVPRACDENCNVPQETEIFSLVEENEEGKLLHLERNKMAGTDSFYRCASLEEFTESQLSNSFKDFSSDTMSTSVILMKADHEKTQLKGEDIPETTIEVHNTAQEYAADINMQNFPELHVSTNSEVENFDEKNVKPDLPQTSESEESRVSSTFENKDAVSAHESPASNENAKDITSDLHQTSESEESRLSSTFENKDDVSAHESPACKEKANDSTSDDEEVKRELDRNSDAKLHDGKQSECVCSDDQIHLSQTDCKAEEMFKSVEAEREIKSGQSLENFARTPISEQQDAEGSEQKHAIDDDKMQRIEAIKRGREREKDRAAVERAIREARERAFAEAKERAERAAMEKVAAEARQRIMAEAREKTGKASTENKPSADKTSNGAKLRAERAAVERATEEARERALEKAMSQKTSMEARVQSAKYSTDRSSSSSRNDGLKHSFSSSDLEKFGANSESAQRRKARLERHQRIMERAAKALAEKNTRDLLAQKEQAERNRLAESLDADIKRWAKGKEGNLRALLSTLQYILGPDSGWQPVPMTDIVTTAAVKKAYRKATLCVHPDKLQQRGASIQQKYVCEKIFDLLKAGWNRFNSEES